MELSVFKCNGEDTGRKIDLPAEVFAVNPNEHVIYLDVKQILAGKRQGTNKTKERGEIHGSTRKIKKQKGTGTARAGSIKSPVFRGGGRVFGPKQRDYSFKLNKKVKDLARRSVLSLKASEKNITILEDFVLPSPCTKDYISILSGFKLFDTKTLLIIPEIDRNILLSSRNLKKAKVVVACDINTYDVLDAQHLLFSERAVDFVVKKLGK